jgi:hypothetical protein
MVPSLLHHHLWRPLVRPWFHMRLPRLQHPRLLRRRRLSYEWHLQLRLFALTLDLPRHWLKGYRLLEQPCGFPLQPQHLRRTDRCDCRGMSARRLLCSLTVCDAPIVTVGGC